MPMIGLFALALALAQMAGVVIGLLKDLPPALNTLLFSTIRTSERFAGLVVDGFHSPTGGPSGCCDPDNTGRQHATQQPTHYLHSRPLDE
jgi:hypothetical protein